MLYSFITLTLLHKMWQSQWDSGCIFLHGFVVFTFVNELYLVCQYVVSIEVLFCGTVDYLMMYCYIVEFQLISLLRACLFFLISVVWVMKLFLISSNFIVALTGCGETKIRQEGNIEASATGKLPSRKEIALTFNYNVLPPSN